MRGLDALFAWEFKSPEPFPMHPLAKTFLDRHGCFTDYPLLGRVTENENDKRIAFQFLEQIRDWPRLYQMEVLAKVIAWRSLKVGDHIPFEEGYQVERIFWLAPHFPAFGLQGKNAAIVLFRGTDLRWKGRYSLLADLDWRGPGYGLYQKNRSALRAWLTGRQAYATGFSLGGALAAYTSCFESDLLTLPSIAFNAPGTYKKLSPGALLTHYTNAGDPVSKVGRYIGEVKQTSFPRSLRPLEAHVTPIFCLYNQ